MVAAARKSEVLALLPETGATPYPGNSATAEGLKLLADEYRRAAGLLHDSGRRGAPASYAPFRLTAIHAIELYLSAFLLASGDTPANVRALGHDLAGRAERAVTYGLVLRQRTQLHLRTLSDGREYLVSRYAADLLSSMSRLNQLTASLEDIASKTNKHLEDCRF